MFPAYAIRGRNGSVEEFLAGLHEEIAAVGGWLADNGLRVTTVYFGGGTPTSITADSWTVSSVGFTVRFPSWTGCGSGPWRREGRTRSTRRSWTS